VAQFAVGEPVTVWVNRVGPYHNPSETYTYFSLPFCRSAEALQPERKDAGIGEVLEGNELVNSGYKLFFGKDAAKTPLCAIPALGATAAATFASAVGQHYWYQLYMDELPVWGMVGERAAVEPKGRGGNAAAARSKAKVALGRAGAAVGASRVFTHRSFSISHNGAGRIIQVNMTSSEPVVPVPSKPLAFSYDVRWKVAGPAEGTFETRFSRYLDYSFFEHQIHWFSIFNSFMMVVFLCGLVSLILIRTLRNDYARYTHDEDDLDVGPDGALTGDLHGSGGMEADSGWKQVHSDVFRKPRHLVLFAALLGAGWQLAALVVLVILLAISEPYACSLARA
jgi:transmembrane 9 superfamily protein 3